MFTMMYYPLLAITGKVEEKFCAVNLNLPSDENTLSLLKKAICILMSETIATLNL